MLIAEELEEGGSLLDEVMLDGSGHVGTMRPGGHIFFVLSSLGLLPLLFFIHLMQI
jgi:hypothetical protein